MVDIYVMSTSMKFSPNFLKLLHRVIENGCTSSLGAPDVLVICQWYTGMEATFSPLWTDAVVMVKVKTLAGLLDFIEEVVGCI